MIGKSLFYIFIQPLVLLIEFIFTVMARIFGNYGIAIIMVSLCVNFLILPLYKRSDALQERERDKQRQMDHWVKHIRKTFKGDERFMMLSTYYRQMDYQPVNALRGSLSLLLQIPFFLAAYHFLSSVDMRGVEFLFLHNLSEPDRLIHVFGLTLNLMPILMTLINCISGFIYTRGFPLKDKVQLYVLAGLFLIVLYNSPSGLVFYWTLNNLFSLLKNVVMKLIEPRLPGKKETAPAREEKDPAPGTFRAACLLLVMLVGLYIPISVVGASPVEFISFNAYRNPLILVWLAFCVALGTFGVWFGIIYYVSSPKGKKILTGLMVFAAFGALLDFMVFGKRGGTVSPLLVFHEGLNISRTVRLANLALILGLAAVLYLVRKYENQIGRIAMIVTVALLALGSYNVVKAQREITEMDYVKAISEDEDSVTVSPILTLSKSGKNVVVFMLDRAISDYLPYIMAEKPELQEQYSGFTYYPNTISFGEFTIYASAAIFGGYEYTPSAMNRRTDVLAVDKQNEALKVMPALFDEAGYHVTVCDPPLAGLREVPDLSIYDDLPNVETHITMGAYLRDDEKYLKRLLDSQDRNLFCYSLMKAAPLVGQSILYDDGNYFEAAKNGTQNPTFLESYSVLTNLAALTDIREDAQGGFVMIDNETPHEPTILQLPDYEPGDSVNNSAYDYEKWFTLNGRTMHADSTFKLGHYHASMAAYLQIGKWLDYLREMGVYDNTRIILVADHGRQMGQFDDLIYADDLDLEGYHPILMMKDFDATGFTVSEELMTNADVPLMAMEGILEDPVNPYTGNPITDQAKTDRELYITTADSYDQHPEYTLEVSTGRWYRFVGDSVFDKDSLVPVDGDPE